MSYLFEISDRNNDIFEVHELTELKPWGEYWFERRDGDYEIYRVLFYDKRGALLFKTKFTATLIRWDESDDQEVVTEEELTEKGYIQLIGRVNSDFMEEFEQWCKEKKVAVVDELKFFNGTAPYTVWCHPLMEDEVKGWFVG